MRSYIDLREMNASEDVNPEGGGGLLDSKLICEDNETLFIRVYKLLGCYRPFVIRTIMMGRNK